MNRTIQGYCSLFHCPGLFDPLSPSITILLAGHHTFVVVLVGKRCSNNKRVSLVIISLFLNNCALKCALILKGEI